MPNVSEMRSDAPQDASRSSILARFARGRDGATAIEFGILALPFLFLIFAILELAMIFWTSQVLETAVANASRQIYTGQFQTDSGNATKTTPQLLAAFKTALCSNVTAVFDCSAEVTVDIRNAASFGGATPPNPVNNGAFDATGYGYQSVGPNQIALVTAVMQYRPTVRMLAGGSTLSNGNRLIMATAAFRTEPYSN